MASPTLDELRSLVQTRTEVPLNQITLDSDLQDLGLESRDMADVMGDIEGKYNVRVNAEDMDGISTVGELYRLLQSKAS